MDTREDTKAVALLQVQQSGDKLYSGSLDRTVCTTGEESIKCIQLYDMKGQVQDMAVANTISYFIARGAGAQVQSWNGSSKLLNPNKHVRCLALLQGKLYCGCSDNSIQEIDLVSGTLSSVQQGNRKLLGKAYPIYALQVHTGFLYYAGVPHRWSVCEDMEHIKLQFGRISVFFFRDSFHGPHLGADLFWL